MTPKETVVRRKRSLYASSAAAFRWIHIYLSMLGFATLMFFAFTGITLNHPTWFGASEQSVRDLNGEFPAELLASRSSTDGKPAQEERPAVNELQIAEWLRAEHQLKGAVKEFSADEFEIMVVFKGPGYAADIFIDREEGSYSLMESTSGIMAVMNDLHKGRDSGLQWSWVIDISAIVTMLLSASGFALMFYIRRRRVTGIATAVAGTILLVAAWAIWVP
ncbi:PepSY-associated TM helix domain-containing protein [Fuerstiella marisgermanici]|uniref:Putative iron-regulated membrane protein n=1 Tax=Fuerstiella marisgermanici TaxID=1891926 RepID=A0A1P8WR19_9PLAN|nr:PepSY-associated TM helix domain-containing protein [Fuerstiella marisgermanici]APZ96507.1 putative iron-regulated membrane protein [Fuerstiella marisgermanici]